MRARSAVLAWIWFRRELISVQTESITEWKKLVAVTPAR